MTGVSHGGDVDRLDQIAGELQQQAHSVSEIGESGTAMLPVLQDAWEGPDVEVFAASWGHARSQVDQAAQALQAAVDELRRQVEEQRGGSEATERRSGPVSPDNNDARDGFWNWIRRKLGDDPWTPREDPGEHNVQMPKGADPDDPMIQEMLRTPSGRATLDWMARNDIEIIVDPNQQGAIYDADRNAMVMGPGYDDASTVVHEANHAQWDAEDRPVDATEVSREEYLDNRLRDESEAVAAEVEFAKEQRANGENVPPDRAEQDYDAAYEAAIADGKSEDEARDAGVDAIQDLFESGYYQTSNTGQSYPDYYGSYWDSVN